MSDIFPINSRYRNVALRTRTLADGTTETFVGRRIIPGMARFRPVDRHRTIDNERIDSVAAECFGDPELYWRICDANGDAEPADATRPTGRLLLIPLPLEIASDGDA